MNISVGATNRPAPIVMTAILHARALVNLMEFQLLFEPMLKESKHLPEWRNTDH